MQFKEAVSKVFQCFQANKPSHFLLTEADSKHVLNIPRDEDAGGEVLPVA